MTALSGGSISEESFAISMAIFAAPYAALQADPLEDLGSSDAASIGSRDEETTDRAMALDESAGTLRFLARRGRDSAGSCFTYSTVGGGLGVRDWLFVGSSTTKTVFERNTWWMQGQQRVSPVSPIMHLVRISGFGRRRSSVTRYGPPIAPRSQIPLSKHDNTGRVIHITQVLYSSSGTQVPMHSTKYCKTLLHLDCKK